MLVAADGDFEGETWRSTGISYQVSIDSAASADDVERLMRAVDEVAEIPKALTRWSARPAWPVGAAPGRRRPRRYPVAKGAYERRLIGRRAKFRSAHVDQDPHR